MTFTTEFDPKKAKLYKRFDDAWKKADSLLDIPDIHRVAVKIVYEGEIVGELKPESTTIEELGLYMAGAKRDGGNK